MAPQPGHQLLRTDGQHVARQPQTVLHQSHGLVVAEVVIVGNQAVDAAGGELGLEPAIVKQQLAQLVPSARRHQVVDEVAKEVAVVGAAGPAVGAGLAIGL